MSTLAENEISSAASVASTRFVYSPLEAGNFRLLEILSTAEGKISCGLQHYRIQDAPQYFALSYVWGDGNPDHAVVIQGTEMIISQNLHEGIHEIAAFLERESLQGYLIWIDAICIDQQNPQEKATQVPLIGDIYAGASTVLLWFGKLRGREVIGAYIVSWCSIFHEMQSHSKQWQMMIAEESLERPQEDLAFLANDLVSVERMLTEVVIGRAELESLYRVISVIDRRQGYDVIQETVRTFRKSERGKHLPTKDHQIWKHLFAFLNNPWWYRLWTIQEIRLAKAVECLASDVILSFDYLTTFRQRLCTTSTAGELYSSRLHLQPGLDINLNSRASLHSLNSESLNNGWQEFQFMLVGICSYRTKIRKDYIYGLLGMVKENIRREIMIDYDGSTAIELVFCQAVKAACGLERGARFWIHLMWLYDEVPKELTTLPSWVPDFSSNEAAETMGVNNSFCSGPSLMPDVISRYYHLEHISFTDDPFLAKIRGYCVDHVDSAMTTALTFTLGDVADIENAIQHVRDGTWRSDMDDVLFCKLTDGDLRAWFYEMESIFPVPEYDSQAAPTWFSNFLLEDGDISLSYRTLRDFVDLVNSLGITTLTEARAFLDFETSEDDLASVAQNLFSLRMVMRGRFVFRTIAGRLGLSSKRLTQGDCIACIPGAGSYLHALSSDKRTYISAQASVEGLMGDVLLDALPTDEDEWEYFDLH